MYETGFKRKWGRWEWRVCDSTGKIIMFGREISRDLIAALREEGLIAAGPRSPKPGAPYAYVTTEKFLAEFGFESLRDLPDLEALNDAGLLSDGAPISEGGAEATQSMVCNCRKPPDFASRDRTASGKRPLGRTSGISERKPLM